MGNRFLWGYSPLTSLFKFVKQMNMNAAILSCVNNTIEIYSNKDPPDTEYADVTVTSGDPCKTYVLLACLNKVVSGLGMRFKI